MGRELGRISGPLLADNLKRNGTNLAFNTKVLFLDVVNKVVSFNFAGSIPTYQVYTPNAIDTIDLLVDTLTSVGDFTLSTDLISHATNSITLSPNQSSNPTIIVPGLTTNNLQITSNVISNTVLNDTINVSPTGSIILNSNVLVSGNLHATGNITFDGNVTLGSNSNDTVKFTAEINSNIIPAEGYNLGSLNKSWNSIYANSSTVSSIAQQTLLTTTLNSGNITITTNQINALTNTDLNLIPNGTGNIKFNGYSYITETTINNPTPTNPFILNNTQKGYTKFTGPGLVVPYGTSNNYPSNPETGTMRFNTTNTTLEIYNANTSTWLPIVGTGSLVTESEIQQITFLNELILGF